MRGLVGRPRTRPDAVAGDKAYSSHGNCAHLRKRRIKAVLPTRYDKTHASYLSGLYLRASMIWLKDLVRAIC